jgi:hypothetical protein
MLFDLTLLRSRAILGDFFREKFYFHGNSIGTRLKIIEGNIKFLEVVLFWVNSSEKNSTFTAIQ